MSLREVLGVTFANLQLAQQSTSLTHPDMNSSDPNVPSSSTTRFVPEPSALPNQATVSVPHPVQVYSGSKNTQFIHTHTCRPPDQPANQQTQTKALLSSTTSVNFQVR